ncbi:MAG TPA: OsmC family protein [Rhizomicrobium sp.]|jgi:uncharacterized OsmC-like protein/quercetin dioxygenase-like cupin family protein
MPPETETRIHQPDQDRFRTIRSEDVQWKPFPAFPPEARLAVLVGDPAKSGPYVTRVKLPAGVKLMPHKHPEDRIYTVISGIFYIGLGETFDEKKLTAYEIGSVVVLPGGQPHFHWAKSGEYITQISAIGPLGMSYVDPANDPRGHAQVVSPASEKSAGKTHDAGTVVVAETGLGPYQLEARAGSASFLVDEPVSAGGQGSGPSPFDLLGAALGACTTLTVRLYATRKGWPLAKVGTVVSHQRASLKARDSFEARVSLEGPLDEEQRSRLLQIAERCPVHLTLDRGADVHTMLENMHVVLADAKPDAAHMDCMKESCADQPAMQDAAAR